MIRLFELRSDKGLSQRAVAKQICISQATYNNWENSKTQPSIEQLIELAAFFEVSIDYLVGNTDEYGNSNIGQNKELSKIRLLRLIESLDEKKRETLISFLTEMLN